MVKSEFIGSRVVFVPVKGVMFPLPVIVEPISGFELIQLYCVPFTGPKTGILTVCVFAHTT